MPNAGGFYDQDPEIMYLWGVIRAEFIAVKNDKNFMDYLNKLADKKKDGK